ncbi:MAG: hypothetical protein QNJ51_13010 [Calothrix sp. MO_167.B12]|nr:hypothetical protein [Calothrix sp. MO_167.B12]
MKNQNLQPKQKVGTRKQKLTTLSGSKLSLDKLAQVEGGMMLVSIAIRPDEISSIIQSRS